MNQGRLAGIVLIVVGIAWSVTVLASRTPSVDRTERADTGAPLATAMQWAGRSQAKAFTIAATLLVVGASLMLTG